MGIKLSYKLLIKYYFKNGIENKLSSDKLKARRLKDDIEEQLVSKL
jgi:hypothetical protein